MVKDAEWPVMATVLDDKVKAIVDKSTPTEEDMLKIQLTFNEIKEVLMNNLIFEKEKIDVLMYGSTVNGLALRGNSDLDITILVDNFDINHNLVL